jgi:hypothetical protein
MIDSLIDLRFELQKPYPGGILPARLEGFPSLS